ncbi:hypothetical protein [Methylobacterium pseudosasicola]|uniref:Uncharacterized protein n=1 Tax=Methylobacterium pseudosasicola TaxID=582667 RepID=A0A1I4VER3_9HYPH|nr:hypothetical protein [Methylobacterium pseudosasicola]SFM99659.1 hypothetical protein SAMN05192568_10976 [Methylobacterium pseudosasicola]
MIPAVDRWGPFADRIEPGERIARLRCLTAIAHLSCGPRAAELVGSLKEAESNPDVLPGALAVLNGLASLDRRRILASYAALNAPARQPRGPLSPEDH